MKTITPKNVLPALLIVLAFTLFGCSSEPVSDDSDRLAALEAEVRALKLEAKAREESFKRDLESLRKSLDGIRVLIEAEQGHARDQDSSGKEPVAESEKLDAELDNKAKSFVSKNLDKLMDITSKLLDKMEKELDEQMQKTAPEPQGDEI